MSGWVNCSWPLVLPDRAGEQPQATVRRLESPVLEEDQLHASGAVADRHLGEGAAAPRIAVGVHAA